MEFPGIVELFSGCGGLGLGFQKAGFEILSGVDIDNSAVQTADYNLSLRQRLPSVHIAGDLTKMEVEDIMIKSDDKKKIVVGGPPCQAYSRAGKGKLRSLGKKRHHLNDPRGLLFEDFLRLALDFEAEAILMENVPDSINYGGINIPEESCNILESEGYSSSWTILNAADYGVPQVRHRMFMLAVKKKYCKEITFPAPTHQSYYQDKFIPLASSEKLHEFGHYIQASPAEAHLVPWVTVSQALSDLPVLFPSAKTRYSLYKPDIILPYANSPENDYQILMRTWNSQSPGKYVSGHGFRNCSRDFPIFEKMQTGMNYEDAIRISSEMLASAASASGISESENPERYALLKKRIQPPYSVDKFTDKWKRLRLFEPSHTVTAHLSVDTYSHIHPLEPRGISVREAARLQSFPDSFHFQSSMGDSFRLIGNAVPPLLSLALARHVMKILQEYDDDGNSGKYKKRIRIS